MNEKETAQNQANIGKFADPAKLLEAYENLEREFTRKSQRLKELEKQLSCDNERLSPQDAPQDNLNDPAQINSAFADNPAQSADELAENLFKNRDILEKYVFNNAQIAAELIGRYAAALPQNDVPPAINSRSGSISLLPPQRPKSLKEASGLAEKMFK